MSHLPERKEKNCLNCGTEVQGRFCQNCGQENLAPKETFWHLLVHFFNDFTHFDGKFFSTLKLLLLKPGFLTAEYSKGRRASYLNPIRMYIFTSAIFFIIFFWRFDASKMTLSNPVEKITDTATWIKVQEEMLKNVDTKKDSMEILDGIRDIKASYLDTFGLLKPGERVKQEKGLVISFDGKDEPKTVREYDSLQKLLPAEKRDGWFLRNLHRKQIDINNRYGDNKTEFIKDLINYFLHQFPKVLFISLPIFALILRLLYVRRKQYFYVDHFIFTIHLYIFTFILMLIFMGMTGLRNLTGWQTVFTIIQVFLLIYLLYYTYKAMRVFYQQRRGKTIVKYLLLNLMAFILVLILISVFFFYSVLQM